MTPLQKSLGLLLYDIGAFQDKSQSPGGVGFKLKLHETNPDAPKSPFYINLRTRDNPKPGPLTPSVVDAIGRQLFEYAESLGLEYDCVAGIPNAGDPIAEAFWNAIPSEKEVGLLKLGKSGTADHRLVEGIISGHYRKGQRVLLIDDLVTKAHTKKEAAEAVRKAGLLVAAILVLVDREQGGAEELEEAGFDFYSVFKITEFLDILHVTGRISAEMNKEIKKYLAENK